MSRRAYCRYIGTPAGCTYGCTTSLKYCHEWGRRGTCRRDESCRYAHAESARFSRARTPPTHDSERYYAGARRDLAQLGLDGEGVNVSDGVIHAVKKARILQTHPDKHMSNKELWTRETQEVIDAATRLLQSGAFKVQNCERALNHRAP